MTDCVAKANRIYEGGRIKGRGSYREIFLKSPSGRYAFLITDMGCFCRKALISALFICKPPL